ncbi:MAG TPA: leucine-rich repeat protein [Bacteroidales bacterium]|nr:leucine-rich repeat protein [Bacteroidales bacterium]
MKRAFKVLGTIVLIFFVTFFSYGCKEKLKTSLEKDKVTIALRENLKVDILSETSEEVIWETEDASIATVENGVIVGVSKGTTYITITSGELSAKIKVTVSDEDGKYIVTWLNYNGDLLELDIDVPHGTMPSYDGEIPRRGADFVFKGWDPKVEPVKGHITYTARFEEINTHTVTWKNWDGSTLAVDNAVVSGAMANYKGPAPTKESDERYDYMFTGWSPAPGQVTYNMTYTAQFTAIQKTFKVTWQDQYGTVLKVEEGVFAGSYASWDGPVPTIHDNPQTGVKRLFKHWLPSPGAAPITEDTTFTAYFVDAYLVSFVSEGVVLQEEHVRKGEMPEFIGQEPRKINDPNDTKYFYTFKEWFPAIEEVKSKNQTYMATYDCFPKSGYGHLSIDEEFEIDTYDYRYQEYGRYAVLKKYKLKDSGVEATIPAWYKGYPILQIGYKAFAESQKLEKLICSDTAIWVAEGMCVDCPALETFVFGKKLTRVYTRMFEKCVSLTDFVVPEGIEKIDWRAFNECENLKLITLPSTLTEIDNSTFAQCKRLVSIHIPASVTNIGNWTFTGCEDLVEVTFGEDSKLIGIGKCTFQDCTSLKYIEIPALSSCIYDYAFAGCESLVQVDIAPEGMTLIGEGAFQDCVSLHRVIFPETLEEIDEKAFRNCDSLFSIDIPASVQKLEGAFSECKNLSFIDVSGQNPKYDSRNDCNAIIETATNKLIKGCKNTKIPNTVEIIGRHAFFRTPFTSITIPASVKTIESYAFYYCHDLPHYNYTDADYDKGQLKHDHSYYCKISLFIPKTVETIQNSGIIFDTHFMGPYSETGIIGSQFCIHTDAKKGEKPNWHDHSDVYGYTYWCSGFYVSVHWADGTSW